MKKLAWLIFIGSCLLFSFQPAKYLLADGPIGLLNSKPIDSYMYMTSFYIHITFGGISLLVGWIQFIKKFRNKYLKLHRIIGKIYVASVLISGPFAFYIGFFVYGGIPTQIGFTLGALFWITFTYMGYSAIRKGNVAKHKEYMMYSYAGTFAAVALRLWLPILMAFTSFKVAYGISVWLSWIPNVFVAYLIIHKKELLITIYQKYRIKKVFIATVVLIVMGFMMSYMSPQTWFYKSAAYDGTAFEKETSLVNSSFTKEKLEEIETYLKEESNTTSMVVLEHGKIVYEYGDISEISYNASVRESILAILYGKYVTNGTINLNQTIGDIGIDEANGLLPIEKKATVDHIMTAKSGVLYAPPINHYDGRGLKERGSVTPGTYFLYNEWDFNVAGYILEEKTGNTVYSALEQQLAIPLGFQDWNIENQQKVENGSTTRYSTHDMHISTRDMAKIGQLLLQEGNWNGKQLIDKNWIQKITTAVTPAKEIRKVDGRDVSSPLQIAYGYMWWTFDRFYDNPDFEGAYTATGEAGQFITIIPKRDVVIVHKTTADILTALNFSNRSETEEWRYWWILRKLMLNRKSISELATEKSTNEIIEYIKTEYTKDSEYAISERLINEYGQLLAASEKHEEAIQFYKLNLERYPKGYYTHRTHDYYGESLLKLGKTDEALTMFEKSLEFHPDNEVAKKEISKLKKK